MVRLNVVYCIPSLYNPGGMERVLTHKVNYLAATGQYDITIITVEQAGKPVYFPLHESVGLIDLDVDFRSYFNRNPVVKWWLHYQKLRKYQRKLSAYLQHHPADICASLGGKELGFITALKDGSIKIAEMHFVRDYKERFLVAIHSGKIWKWIGLFLTWNQDRNVKKLKRLIVLSKADALAWQQIRGNVTQIYNPVEPVQEAGIIRYQQKIIAVGRLEPEKGFDSLIEAWSVVAGKHPDWALHLWGEGTCRAQLEKMIAERGLTDQVFLKGTTQSITQEYLTSYANVVSSRYEGLSMALLEAMSCGLPLISFDCPCGPAELIREGQNGFLVPQGDCQALAACICRLIEDPVLRERMAAASLKYSKAYHTNVIMPQWMELFDSLVQHR